MKIIIAILWPYQAAVAFWSCWYHNCFGWGTVECSSVFYVVCVLSVI